MSEEAKKDDEVTIADLKEVIDGQSHRIDALTSLVRAQQVTMDRLLRAVEKGAAIPAAAAPPPAPQAYAGATRQAYAPSTSSRTGPTGYGAAPQAYGPGSASDPSAARAREHAQRLEAERQRSEAAPGPRRASRPRSSASARRGLQGNGERQDQLRREAEARAEAQRKEREALAAKRAEEARLKKEAEEAERRKIEAAKKAQQAKLAASRSKVPAIWSARTTRARTRTLRELAEGARVDVERRRSVQCRYAKGVPLLLEFLKRAEEARLTPREGEFNLDLAP